VAYPTAKIHQPASNSVSTTQCFSVSIVSMISPSAKLLSMSQPTCRIEASPRVLCELDHALRQAHPPELFILILLFISDGNVIAHTLVFALLFISFTIIIKHYLIPPGIITFGQQRRIQSEIAQSGRNDFDSHVIKAKSITISTCYQAVESKQLKDHGIS